jgi:hypothetical protein
VILKSSGRLDGEARLYYNNTVEKIGKVSQMKRKTLVALALLLCLLFSAAGAEERQIVPTADWTPPDLSQLTADSTPELLLLKVAQEEVGYVEGPHNDESKYGDWFSGGRVAWCAEFLTWSVDQVDQRYGTHLMNVLFPWYGGSSDGAPFFIEKGRFISDDGRIPTTYAKQWLIGSDHYLKANEYIPFAGDYIWFFYHSRREGTEHVAVVEGVSRDEDGAIKVHVIEGNNPDRVQRAVYDLADKRIYGFGTPVKRAYTNLRLYYQNADVAQLQKDLITLGYYQPENKREGYFTVALKDAVKQFQKDSGISVSGIVDIETRPALDKALERNASKEP